MENENGVNYEKIASCLNELLEIDRQDSERFHEDFVRIIVEYGYYDYLTLEETQWYENNKDEYGQSIGEYVLFA